MASLRKPRLVSRATNWTARQLRRMSDGILQRNGIGETWIDVGAHHGEVTLGFASRNPGLRVYAFEPNLRAAARLFGKAPNYIAIPVAVGEEDGSAELYVNQYEASSSLLPLSEDPPYWSGGTPLRVESTMRVPTVRLDTFMDLMGIPKVDFLKIDAQGMDLAVIRSAGKRLTDIDRITLEVWVGPRPQYLGTPSKEEVLEYLAERGFALVGVESQTDGLEENLTFERKANA
jgi:FkbM family methyltransferase